MLVRVFRISFALVLALIAAFSVAAQQTEAQASDGVIFYHETGYWVGEEFNKFWGENGGIMTFGYPISRVFYQNGLEVQYFERAVLEHHEDLDPPYQVLAARLGAIEAADRKAEPEFQRVGEEQTPAGGHWFPETGHTLSGIFQEHWNKRGGLMAFGYPLSEPFMEPDTYTGEPLLVQYFERVRMEYHPEYEGTRDEVLFGHLGVERLREMTIPPLAVTPQSPDHTDPPIGPQPLYDRAQPPCGYSMLFWTDNAHDPENVRYAKMAADSGCEWIRFQFAWSTMQPEAGADVSYYIWTYQRIIDIAKENKLKVLVDIAHPPAWALPADQPWLPADPTAFADFLRQVVSQLGDKVDAWQIWNEPNLADNTNGIIDPRGMLELARAAYPVIKEIDPDAKVVSPGLAPTSLQYEDWAFDDDIYFERMLALNGGEILNYFDVIGVHAYGAGNPPDTYWPSTPSDNPEWSNAPEFYFRHIEEYHRILETSGALDKPVWITEAGWPVANASGEYGYGEYVTEDLQAQYVVRGMEIVRTEWDWVDQVFLWNLNAAPYSGADSVFGGFSHVREDGTARPVYGAIEGYVTE